MCIDQNHVLLFRLQVVSAIALPNLAQLLEATAQRFSCVLGMLSSLGVKVPRPT